MAGVKKPDPQLIHAVLDALGDRPMEAVMVGDAANDVAAARAAEIPVILRAGGYTRVPAKELDADRSSLISSNFQRRSVVFPQRTLPPDAVQAEGAARC